MRYACMLLSLALLTACQATPTAEESQPQEATAMAEAPEVPGMQIDVTVTALVITDPQNDFLSPEGVTWALVGKNVTENNTVANRGSRFRRANRDFKGWRLDLAGPSCFNTEYRYL